MNDRGFQSHNIGDIPDSWFDLVQAETRAFLEKWGEYPIELAFIAGQVIFQNLTYIVIEKGKREAFLKLVCESFNQQFKEWDGQEADTRDT
jgi:hypothetical protein